MISLPIGSGSSQRVAMANVRRINGKTENKVKYAVAAATSEDSNESISLNDPPNKNQPTSGTFIDPGSTVLDA